MTISSAELHRVGDGPVATVYSGHHGGVPVALKVFPKRLDKRTLAAFNKEQAKLSAARRVTSVLPVDGVDELDTGEFAVRMELCTESLTALVDRVGSLPPADAVVLGSAVAAALAAAHGAGVVHGGMSPHNILFRTTGEPVLADFGVTLRQAFARDPSYAIEFLPPETLRTGVLNESTDLYGLGAVLHYALTGRSPHPGRLGEQPGERVLRILGEPVPAINNPNVPVALSTLVARLLSADAARRLDDAAEVATRLGAMLPDAPQRPAVDEFDDFSAAPPVRPPRPLPPSPARQAPYVPGLPDDGDDFDDFAVPAYHAAPPPPVPRPAVAPPPVAGRPVTGPDEGNDAHWSPGAGPAQPPAAGPPDQAAQRRALRRERLRTAAATPHPADGDGHPAATGPQAVPAVPGMPPELSTGTGTVSPQDAGNGVVPPPEPSAGTGVVPPRDSGIGVVAPQSAGTGAVPSPGAGIGVVPSPGAGTGVVPSPGTGTGVMSPRGAETGAASPQGTPVRPSLAAPPPVPPYQGGVLRPDAMPTDALPAQAAAGFGAGPHGGPARRPAGIGDPPSAEVDEFGDFASRPRSTVVTFAPPKQKSGRKVRYDLLIGVALVLALLALVPLLILRDEPDELQTTPRVPSGGSSGGDVRIVLEEPVDLIDQVKLTWTSNVSDLDFGVVVAEEGKGNKVLLAERNNSLTVHVRPGRKYCFLVQGLDGQGIYESEPVGLRGATCRE